MTAESSQDSLPSLETGSQCSYDSGPLEKGEELYHVELEKDGKKPVIAEDADDLYEEGLIGDEQAEQINRDVLKIRRRVLGPRHPSTLRTQANLGRTLLRQRRLSEAETELRSAWTTQVSQRGKSHSDTLSTKRALARCRDLVARQPGTTFVGTRDQTVRSREVRAKSKTAQENASHP